MKRRAAPAWIFWPSRARRLKRVCRRINAGLKKVAGGTTVVSIVGVNGTGKTTTSAKLAHFIQSQNQTALLAACDTFRAAAIEQLKLWGARLKVEVIAGDLWRGRRIRGARCRHRRAGAPGGLSVH